MPQATGTLGGMVAGNPGPGMMPVGGTGQTPTGWAAAPGQNSGFNTPGYQYGLQEQGPIQKSIQDNSGQYNTGYIDPSTAAVHTVGGAQNYDQNSLKAAYDQMASRLDPQWNQRQSDLESQLANMGLTRGSEAWNREMDNMTRGRTDAYQTAMNSAITGAAADAARLQGMDINAGNFANAAQQQDYQNKLTSQNAQNTALTGQQALALGAGNFANAAQQQGFNQNLQEAQLNNAALGTQQGFQSQQNMADMQLKAAQAAAQGQAQAAAAAAAGQREIAQMNNALAQQQLQMQERAQDFSQARQMYYDPIITQNMLTQGMYDTQMPTFNQFNTAPGIPGMEGMQQQANQGQNQMLSGIGGILGSLGGKLF